jgi:16S rRNA (guanine(527)-N(7))-methyltransferase RsmG
MIDSSFWNSFISAYYINKTQEKQLLVYVNYLLEENKKYNLTRITEHHKIVSHHLHDALCVGGIQMFKNSSVIADVGSGCGVPGIPLAIMHPDKQFILIEVTEKKIKFLNETIQRLGLTNCIVDSQDYRTFARKSEHDVNLFISRASLHIKDLLFIYFDEQSLFTDSNIIYWGTEQWRQKEFVNSKIISYKEYPYMVEDKKRIYVLIKK